MEGVEERGSRSRGAGRQQIPTYLPTYQPTYHQPTYPPHHRTLPTLCLPTYLPTRYLALPTYYLTTPTHGICACHLPTN
eukprot:86838-Rhodomonas_salina.1